MEVYLTRTMTGLVPADDNTEAWYNSLKLGEVVHEDLKRMRNYKFFRKWFALLRLGFENWNPGEINSKYGVPLKNFERFRQDLVILTGRYDTVIRLDGSTRVEAKSISFAKMDEAEFQNLYSDSIDVLLQRVYQKDMDAEKLNQLVDKILTFA